MVLPHIRPRQAGYLADNFVGRPVLADDFNLCDVNYNPRDRNKIAHYLPKMG